MYCFLRHVVEDFMQEHPRVTVTVETNQVENAATASYMEKYTTRIMTGDGFDIVEPSLVNMEKCVGQGIITHEMEGKTVLMITHHYHQLEGFDRIFHLKDGRLREREREN